MWSHHWAKPPPILCFLLPLVALLAGAQAQGEGSPVPDCSKYNELYSSIDEDLSLWTRTGISLDLIQRTAKQYTTQRTGGKGFLAGFIGGKAYIVDKPKIGPVVGHHAALWITYMRLMLHLEKLFGSQIPDVEFIINTLDRPVLLAEPGDSSVDHFPVMQFCRTDAAYAIRIPIYHFYSKGFDELLHQIPQTNAKHPWESRMQNVLGSYSIYKRYLHRGDIPAQRVGVGGVNICYNDTTTTAICHVRRHFGEWAGNHSNIISLNLKYHMSMLDHATWRWLLHLDGQGLSSKFDQLLPLGSLIFKEESGYKAFYYHLLKPYVHYIPFWKKYPEEILEAVQWAQDHDQEAKVIATAAQAFAQKYLTSEARSCYMLTLLQRYSKLLNYTPGKTVGRKYMQYWKPVGEYLEEEMKPLEKGRWWKTNFTV